MNLDGTGGKGNEMSFRIDLSKRIRPQLIFAGIAILGFAAFSIYYGAPFIGVVLAFALLAVEYLVQIQFMRLFFFAHPRTVYDFTPMRVTQSLKGKTIKELSLTDGVRIYRRLGIYRNYLVFSSTEIPKGAQLRVWKDSPKAIIVPYNLIWTRKLSRYFERAMSI